MPFEVPSGPERPERLASVLEVVYLIFNEGYAATGGDDWIRPALCDEALRLGRLLAVAGAAGAGGARAARADASCRRPGRRPGSARPARRCCCATRTAAVGPAADRGAGWPSLARPRRSAAPGRTRLQAAIAACHAVAPSVDETDWVADRRALRASWRVVTGSPVVELNRAVAVAQAYGPAAGLEIVDGLRGDRGAARLPPAAERPRRAARRARARRRGPGRVRPGGGAGHNEQERALLRRRAADLTGARPGSLGDGPEAGAADGEVEVEGGDRAGRGERLHAARRRPAAAAAPASSRRAASGSTLSSTARQ